MGAKATQNPLLVSSSSDTILPVCENTFAASTGLAGDSRAFVDQLRRIALHHSQEFGSVLPVAALIREGLLGVHDNRGGRFHRPMASGFIIAGIEGGVAHMVKGSTAADAQSCLAAAIGESAEQAEQILAERFVKDQAAEEVNQMLMAVAQQISPQAQWETKIVKL
jgi:20S proteasome alpha/beta subunit